MRKFREIRIKILIVLVSLFTFLPILNTNLNFKNSVINDDIILDKNGGNLFEKTS